MKIGATGGGGFGEGGGRGEGRRGEVAAAPAAPSPKEREAGGRAGGGQPRDPEQGFRSLGRWGIKNVVASAQIADGRLYATVDELKRLTDIADKYGIRSRTS
jgi:mannonate dehydratase